MGFNIYDELGYFNDEDLIKIILFCNQLIKERKNEVMEIPYKKRVKRGFKFSQKWI